MLEEINDSPISIRQIIADEIGAYAKEMNLTTVEAIKDIHDNTGLGLRTLERYIRGDLVRDPYPKSVISFYSYIYKTKSLSELITKVPESVTEYILRDDFKKSKKAINSEFQIDPLVDSRESSDSLFCQIYLEASREFPKPLEIFQVKFGINGLKKIDSMIEKGYLKINDKGEILRDKEFLWDRRIIWNFSKTAINDIFNVSDFDLMPEIYNGFASIETTREDAAEAKEILKASFRAVFKKLADSKPTEDNRVNLLFLAMMTKIDEQNGELK